MGGPSNQRIVQNAEDWMRQVEKKVLREERRPIIRKASDLMGPTLGPFAVQITDWNGEETHFNGLVFSEPGALNSPDDALTWLGMVIAAREGHGLQQAWNNDGPEPLHYIRSWSTGVSPIPLYTPWVIASGTGGAPEGHTHPPDAYVHTQDVPSASWTITHNLGFFPSVTIVDSGGTNVGGVDVLYINENSVRVDFGAAFGGKAYLS